MARTSIALADGEWDFVYIPFCAFLCFLLGATLSGYTISFEVFYLGRAYGRNLFIVASLQTAALLVHTLSTRSSGKNLGLLYACALAMGTQNALTSKYSGNALRTTHLTGAATDLGIALGHLLKGRWEDLWKVQLHCSNITGFLLGGVGGRHAYKRIQELALVVNISLLLLLGLLHVAFLARQERVSMVKVRIHPPTHPPTHPHTHTSLPKPNPTHPPTHPFPTHSTSFEPPRPSLPSQPPTHPPTQNPKQNRLHWQEQIRRSITLLL